MSPTNLEPWQTEWCPASHRVRQRLTELGLAYVVRQVPVEREARPLDELEKHRNLVDGFDDAKVRAVSENAATLKFEQSGFEDG